LNFDRRQTGSACHARGLNTKTGNPAGSAWYFTRTQWWLSGLLGNFVRRPLHLVVVTLRVLVDDAIPDPAASREIM